MTPTPLTRDTLADFPLPPVEAGDKDSKGRILIVAGSKQVPGAALLTATAAMRAGAGKLKIAAPDSVAIPIGIAMPEAMVVGLAEHRNGILAGSAVAEVGDCAAGMDAIVAGPGLPTDGPCARIAAALLATSAPLVLDAALLRVLEAVDTPRLSLPILLPHAGEMSALIDCSEEEVEADPINCGLRAAARFGALVLVKGVTSHVVTPDGRVWVYHGGVAGLGVSGSGDTLAGIVGGLLARGTEPLSALLWSVLLHGEAGQALTTRVGALGFLAREIPGEIPALLAR